MEPIDRGSGVTESERYLARLADATFLDLWSYPNTFIDKKTGNTGDGKELCDLLVVFGDDVLIFSDKSCAWPNNPNVDLSWSRWYRRAVQKSVGQIRGAERWLTQFSERIFLDRGCTRRLPINLPPLERRRVHGIAIALGAQGACSKHYSDPDGSLMVLSALKGDAHSTLAAPGYTPFALGDVDPDGPFVHVFDETGLDLVMRELDTVSDFVRYLDQRKDAIRTQRLRFSPSEAEMLAVYLTSGNDAGDHVFPMSDAFEANGKDSLTLEAGHFAGLIGSKEYQAKKRADEESYVWDRLIGAFTENILAGTSVEIAGVLPSAARAEPALRMMARENRTSRRALGSAFAGALEEAERQGQDRFARVVLPNERFADPECGYVFLILAYPKDFQIAGGYEQYRRVRVSMLEAYCAAALYDNRRMKRMVGVAIDASSKVSGRKGGSEDLLALEISNWTEAMEKEVSERRAQLDILRADRLTKHESHMFEYPRVDEDGVLFTRQQRRAAERRAKKAARHALRRVR